MLEIILIVSFISAIVIATQRGNHSKSIDKIVFAYRQVELPRYSVAQGIFFGPLPSPERMRVIAEIAQMPDLAEDYVKKLKVRRIFSWVILALFVAAIIMFLIGFFGMLNDTRYTRTNNTDATIFIGLIGGLILFIAAGIIGVISTAVSRQLFETEATIYRAMFSNLLGAEYTMTLPLSTARAGLNMKAVIQKINRDLNTNF